MEPTKEDGEFEDNPEAFELASHVLMEESIQKQKTKIGSLIWILIAITIIIIVIIILTFVVFKKKSNNSSSKYTTCR